MGIFNIRGRGLGEFLAGQGLRGRSGGWFLGSTLLGSKKKAAQV